MRSRKCSTIPQFLSSVLVLALLTAFGIAQAAAAGGGPRAGQVRAPSPTQATPAQMAPQVPSICGNQPLCAEAADFAATVADFRTSNMNGWKIIDVVVRFQNKINQPIILGYVDGSLGATDDQGNRYVMAGTGQGIRGIGIISGDRLDPKFVLQAGGVGDARFELAWRPNQKEIQGSTFELYVTTREATPVQGGQYMLGGEFPFQYQGLANGVRAALSPANASAPGLITGAAPATSGAAGAGGAGGVVSAAAGTIQGSAVQPGCVPAGQGAQNAASTVSNTASAVGVQNQKAAAAASQVSGAASTISSIGSLFGRKKAAAAPAQNATGASPCPPGYTFDPNAVSVVTPSVTAASPQASGAASSAPVGVPSVSGNVSPVAGAVPAAAPPAPGSTATATVPMGGATVATSPAATQAQAPAKAVSPATKAQAARPVPRSQPSAATPSAAAPAQPAAKAASSGARPSSSPSRAATPSAAASTKPTGKAAKKPATTATPAPAPPK